MDQFILFGDSLTQQCFSQVHGFAFGAALADVYARKLDIVNRGLSGYNTTQALRALALCMPEPEHAHVRFMAIWFGANDSRIQGSPGGPDQSVPIDEFKRNIKSMVQHPAVQAHEAIKIILITCPPLDERKALKHDQEKYPVLGRVLRRTASNTAQYSQAIRDLGDELDLTVLDLWTAMMSRTGNTREQPLTPGSLDVPPNQTLQSYVHDGLHLSGEGYRVLYGELMTLIERTWPDDMPARRPMRFPAWDDLGAWNKMNAGNGGKDGKEVVSGRFEAVVDDVEKTS